MLEEKWVLQVIEEFSHLQKMLLQHPDTPWPWLATPYLEVESFIPEKAMLVTLRGYDMNAPQAEAMVKRYGGTILASGSAPRRKDGTVHTNYDLLFHFPVPRPRRGVKEIDAENKAQAALPPPERAPSEQLYTLKSIKPLLWADIEDGQEVAMARWMAELHPAEQPNE
jgi:hypothetical protein